MDRLSSSNITVLAGTSPDGAESFCSFPQSGRRPRAPSAVATRHAKLRNPQKILVLWVNATRLKRAERLAVAVKEKK